MAKISARGDKELDRAKFVDGSALILTCQGRILFKDPVDGRLRLLATRKQVRDPRDAFKRLVASRTQKVDRRQR